MWRGELDQLAAAFPVQQNPVAPPAEGVTQADPAPPADVAAQPDRPDGIPLQAELPGLVDKGLRMVSERLGASPDFSVYLSIQRQLEYLHETMAAGQLPTAEKIDSLTLGVYAAREFETSDPAFAEVLFNVHYLAARMLGPR